MTLEQGDRLLVAPEDWLEVIEREYLQDYVRAGGSAVKVLSGDPAVLAQVTERLARMAVDQGYWHVRVDPSALGPDGRRLDAHRIDRLFGEVTREVDWRQWAAAQARSFLRSRGIALGEGRALDDLDGIATDNGRTVEDLLAEYQRDFATPQLRDRRLTLEFRAAVTALGRAQLIPDEMTPTAAEVLLAWFRAEHLPGAAAALRRVRIFSRINANNARHLLTSFCRWLPHTGHAGLVLVLDLRPYEHKRVPLTQRRQEELDALHEAIAAGASLDELRRIVAAATEEPAVTYSDAAYLQMLAQVRRFIDEVDEFEHFLLVMLTTPRFYDPAARRNYFNYDALQTRIGLEVHDAVRANPAACLVHLGDPR